MYQLPADICPEQYLSSQHYHQCQDIQHRFQLFSFYFISNYFHIFISDPFLTSLDLDG